MNKHICISNCKSMILYVLVACCIVSIGYSKVFEIETVFTHLFYIPIVLAGIWWQNKKSETSHDFINPLSIIDGYLALLMEGGLSDEQRQRLQIVSENVKRIDQLVQKCA